MKTKFPFTDLHANIEEFYEKFDKMQQEDQSLQFTNWEEVRSYYPLDKNITYLNSGTEGSMPEQVLSEYQDYLHKWASSPSYYFAFNKITQDYQKVNRAKVADFISTKEENVCITSNTTEGLGMVLMGLQFEEGDEVIVSLQAYPSLISPLNVLCKTKKIKYKVVPLPTYLDTKQEIVDAFASAITKKTKAICVSHITYTTGLKLPVKEICDLARKNNAISLIDGAHATGMIPLDMEDIGCDFYSAAGHKWLNGPPGTGLLYIKEALKNEHNLLPILSELYGFENTYSITDILQIRGCNNTPGYTALCGAIKLNTDIGKERIYNRILELNDYAKERIIAEWGEKALLTPFVTKEIFVQV
jgi:selenocysteine lyase/cysteine desulfurase